MAAVTSLVNEEYDLDLCYRENYYDCDWHSLGGGKSNQKSTPMASTQFKAETTEPWWYDSVTKEIKVETPLTNQMPQLLLGKLIRIVYWMGSYSEIQKEN